MKFNKNIIINKIKRRYINDSIMQFLLSYTLVLIIPLLILIYGFQSAFAVIENQINQSNISMIEHSKNLIDLQLNAMESKVLQISKNSRINDLFERVLINSDFFTDSKMAIKEFENLMKYQEVSIVKSSYIYLKNSNYVIYEGSLYKKDDFRKYIDEKYNISLNQWEKLCSNNGSGVPYYVTINGHLQYIKPFTTKSDGISLGAIVCEIDENKLEDFLSIENEDNKRSVFIYDNDKKLLWSIDNGKYKNKVEESKLNINNVTNNKGLIIVNSKSSLTNWNFIMAIPERVVLNELIKVKILIIILSIIASIIGLLLSIYMAIKKGRPINEIFNIFNVNREKAGASDTVEYKNSEKLGYMFSEIIKNNKTLLEEIESEKPLLKHAFLNKLVKGYFVNVKELDILASKVGITIKSNNFIVTSFRLFLNNDLYDVDSQTMSEVQVLFHLIQNYIKENFHEDVWFYEKDYLTTLAIFPIIEGNEDIKSLAEEIHKYILEQYGIDSTWGISHLTKNILDLWRACEEASIANLKCQEDRIMVYNKQLEDSGEFYYPELLEEKIVTSIKAADISSLSSNINLLYIHNYKKRNLNKKNILQFNKKMISTFNVNFSLSQDVLKEIEILKDISEENENLGQTYFKQLNQICEKLCSEFQKKKRCNTNKLINDIVEYINSQYFNSNLGLSLIASKFSISEGYVSTIFKTNMGINFADYVEKVRIDYACVLLKDLNNTINSISEQTGYNSVQSFRRAFKKIKGVSPRELRSSIENETYFKVQN